LVSAVLSTLRATTPEGGSTVATLMRLCNISYGGLQRMLGDLVKAEMVLPVRGELNSGYVITEKGLRFLNQYLEFQSFAEAYGLQL
jgi:predicted transcriptional regulator